MLAIKSLDDTLGQALDAPKQAVAGFESRAKLRTAGACDRRQEGRMAGGRRRKRRSREE